MLKKRLWRVDVIHEMDCQAPSFWVETKTNVNKTREEAENEALKIAKEKTRLSDFPKSWNFKLTHLESHVYIETPHWKKWVKQGVYRMDSNGVWRKNKQKHSE